MSGLVGSLSRLAGICAGSLPPLLPRLHTFSGPASSLKCGRLFSPCLLSPPPPGSLSALRSMTTLNQLHRQGKLKPKPKKLGVMEGNPQLKGVVLKVLVKKPKKPNSANRKCVRVRLSTGKEAVAYIPGEGHNLQEHSIVLVQGGRVPDLPGVKIKCIRGKYDLAHVVKK